MRPWYALEIEGRRAPDNTLIPPAISSCADISEFVFDDGVVYEPVPGELHVTTPARINTGFFIPQQLIPAFPNTTCSAVVAVRGTGNLKITLQFKSGYSTTTVAIKSVTLSGYATPQTVHLGPLSSGSTADSAQVLIKTANAVAADIYVSMVQIYEDARLFYFSTDRGFTAIPSGPAFAGRIIQPGNYKQSAFESGKTYGVSQVGYGEIVLDNRDGALDYLGGFAFSGRPAVLRSGYPEQSWPNGWSTIYTGGVEQALFDWTTITLRIRDRQAELIVPLTVNTFQGTNVPPDGGLEGTASDAKNKPKPYLVGSVRNISPPLCNSSRRIYAVNPPLAGTTEYIPVWDNVGSVGITNLDAINPMFDESLRGVVGPNATSNQLRVFHGGVLLNPGPDYPSDTELTAADGNFTINGTTYDYRAWPAGGYFRLNLAPTLQVTCDATSANANQTPAAIIRELLENQIGWTSGEDFSVDDLATVRSATPSWVMGLWFDQVTTVAQALDRIMTAIGACYTFDATGMLRITRISTPTMAPELTLTSAQILTVERRASGDAGAGIPARKITIRHSRNYTPQSSGLGGVVTDERRAWLAEQWRETVAADDAVAAAWPLAPELVFETDLDADHGEAARRLAVFGVRRDRLEVTVRLDTLSWQTIRAGTVIGLDLGGRYGYGSSPVKAMLCLGVITDLARGTITITLWG